MAKWNTFHWSDGTLWGTGFSDIQLYTSFIDRLFFYCSLKIQYTALSSLTSAPVIARIAAEVGPRAQLPNNYSAFIDENDETQYLSTKVFYTFDSVSVQELTTEDGDTLLTEDDDTLVVGLFAPFSIDTVYLIANARSRQQPVG